MPNLEPCVTSAAAMRRHRLGTSVVVLVLVLVAALLGGCGGLRLHSETRQQQGEAAAKAWKDVDLKAFFDAERANQARLLQTEIDAWSRHVGSTRHEGKLRALAAMPVDGYAAEYETLLRSLTLGGTGRVAAADMKRVSEAIDEAARQLIGLRSAQKTYQLEVSFLRSHGAPAFSCAQLTDANRKIVKAWLAKNPDLAGGQDVDGTLKAATQACEKIDRIQAAYAEAVHQIGGGSLKARADDWARTRDDLLAKQADVDRATIAYNDALKAYEDEIRQPDSGPSGVDKAKALADQVGTALKLVESVQGVFGEEVASEERIQRIDALLASLKSGEPLASPDASRLEIAISMFPTIRDDLQAVKDAKKGRAAVPLLIQRDIEQARLNAARIQVARQKQVLAIRQALVESTVLQAQSVLVALDRVNSFDEASPDAAPAKEARAAIARSTDKALDGVWGGLQPKARRALLESTVHYLDASTRQEAFIQALNKQVDAMPIERAVDLAEVNATLWASLIGATVEQAAEFSALGIRAADIDRILALIGLFYIGHGVNK